MKFLDAVGPIAISKSVWSQLLDENEKGRSVTSFQDVSLDGSAFNYLMSTLLRRENEIGCKEFSHRGICYYLGLS